MIILNFLAEKIQKIFDLQMTCKPMIVFDTNKEIPYFFIHIPQTITYSNFSNFKWLGKFHPEYTQNPQNAQGLLGILVRLFF